MITLSVDDYNLVSQDFYDNTIGALQFHQLTCTCGLSAGLTIHGYYYRGIKSGDGIVRLRICRVKCCHCGKTHALLLSSFVPYSQILLNDQLEILVGFENDRLATSVMEHTPSIDENHLRFIIQQYRAHWQQRLLAARIPLLSKALIQSCFSYFARQFMQIKNTANILFSAPT